LIFSDEIYLPNRTVIKRIYQKRYANCQIKNINNTHKTLHKIQ